MIAHLRGAVAALGTDFVVVDVSGVGYKCQVPSGTRSRLTAGQEVLLQTSLQVREDSMTLFGFSSSDEFDLFELLLKVEGIGPKVAMGVLSAATPENFRRAIAFEDLTALCRIPGIGKKTAQRMVLELRERIGSLGVAGGTAPMPIPGAKPAGSVQSDPVSEALEALVSLGYSRLEAVQALDKARREAGEDLKTETLVRLGLKYLFRG